MTLPHLLTFDCYGTMIDWETGLEQSLRPVFQAHGINADRDRVLELFGALESRAQSGGYVAYREVLRRVLDGIGESLGFKPSPAERDAFAESVRDWPPFPDSPGALTALQTHCKLAVISNVDDDLFASSEEQLGVRFDWVITAQQVRDYKPSHRMFEAAFERTGVARDRIVHVAQSRFHDIEPAVRLGLRTIWVNRRRGRAGEGATPPSSAVPEREVGSLAEVAELAEAGTL